MHRRIKLVVAVAILAAQQGLIVSSTGYRESVEELS